MTKQSSNLDLAEFIDHSLLNPTATPELVTQWCTEAEQYGFPTVCVYPAHVKQAGELLHRKSPQVCTVIGFPTGATTSQVKLYEAQEAVDAGATELDVMLNLGWLKSGKTNEIYQELAEICETTGQLVKVILETHLLTDAEKILAAEVSLDAGVAFLATNTGWCGGATATDVSLLKKVTKDQIGIKAAGGIRTSEQALELILAGATRLGTSWSVDILRQRDTLEKGTSTTSSSTH